MKIRYYPDPVLRIVSTKVDKIDSTIKNIIRRMKEVMRRKEGIGLAANQVGITRRIIIVDFFDNIEAMINPEIISTSEEKEINYEGCLSFPEMNVEIPRFKELTLKYMNEKGQEIMKNLDEIHSIAIQHEIDHLNGVLIIDFLEGEERIAYELNLAKRSDKQCIR